MWEMFGEMFGVDVDIRLTDGDIWVWTHSSDNSMFVDSNIVFVTVKKFD